MAVVDGVNTGSPQLYMVHVDHLARPVRLTNSSKASVWDAVYTPWGAPHAITGTVLQNARFPGQWFQLEAGLHYNWHRHYDLSSGRYTQPDPLGFIDGPIVYAYVELDPLAGNDVDGLNRLRRSQSFPGRPSFLRDPCPGCLEYPARTPRGGVYTLRDPRQPESVCRVGRTNDFDRRERELLKQYPNLTMYRDYPTDCSYQQRGREQQLYDLHNPQHNYIRPISPTNPRLDLYMRSIRK